MHLISRSCFFNIILRYFKNVLRLVIHCYELLFVEFSFQQIIAICFSPESKTSYRNFNVDHNIRHYFSYGINTANLI